MSRPCFLAFTLVCLILSGLAMPVQAAPSASSDFPGQWECWQDGSLDPCHNTLNGIGFVAPSSGWAVGSSGMILRWNGDAWIKWPSPTGNALNGLIVLSETDAWTVGSRGTKLHWNGAAWESGSDSNESSWYGIDALATDDVWAAGLGNSTNLSHFDGTSWHDEHYPTYKIFQAVDMVAHDDVWVAGRDGLLLHRSGEKWEEVPSPVNTNLRDISMITASDGWAVGEGGAMLRWDGESWMKTASPTSATLTNIEMRSANDGWAAGYGVFLHWNGLTWSALSAPDIDVTAMTFTGDNQIEAVGLNGALARYAQGQWTGVLPKPWAPNFWSVDMLSARDGWAVGIGSGHWDGLRWTPVSVPTEHLLRSVSVVSADNVWAVGGVYPSYPVEMQCDILHWDGRVWSAVSCPVSELLNEVAFSGPNDGWAVGIHGVILHWDGLKWTQVASPTGNTLESVSATSPLNAWAVGYRCALHWDGRSWTEDLPAPPLGLSSVALLSDGTGWAAGQLNFHPYFATLSSGSWWGWEDERGGLINAIAAVSSHTAWAVGTADIMIDGYRPGSNIYYCPGIYCLSSPSPTSAQLFDVDMVSANDGWAVGSGVILHFMAPRYPAAAYLPLIRR